MTLHDMIMKTAAKFRSILLINKKYFKSLLIGFKVSELAKLFMYEIFFWWLTTVKWGRKSHYTDTHSFV